jgi:hypothetical protein
MDVNLFFGQIVTLDIRLNHLFIELS